MPKGRKSLIEAMRDQPASSGNTWPELQTYGSGINVNAETITDFTGCNLSLASGVLNVGTPRATIKSTAPVSVVHVGGTWYAPPVSNASFETSWIAPDAMFTQPVANQLVVKYGGTPTIVVEVHVHGGCVRVAGAGLEFIYFGCGIKNLAVPGTTNATGQHQLLVQPANTAWYFPFSYGGIFTLDTDDYICPMFLSLGTPTQNYTSSLFMTIKKIQET